VEGFVPVHVRKEGIMSKVIVIDFARGAPAKTLAPAPAPGAIPLPPPRPQPALSTTAVLMTRDARNS
jgi:hypothetical protein